MHASPFPGMDPFLEANPVWQTFHGWFVRKLAELHRDEAEARDCTIDVERSVYRPDSEGELALLGEPDVLSFEESVDGGSERTTSGRGTATLAEPRAVHEVLLDPDDPAALRQEYLVVRSLGETQRVLAVVELLSPANKSGSFAEQYRRKRWRFLTSRTHFLEIDLLRGGGNPSRDAFPELEPAPYFLFVARQTAGGRHEEGYPLRMQDPLPRIGLPLGPGRGDLPLDLEAAFRAAYDLTWRPGWFRYDERPIPPPPLEPFDAEWVRSLLGQAAGTA